MTFEEVLQGPSEKEILIEQILAYIREKEEFYEGEYGIPEVLEDIALFVERL